MAPVWPSIAAPRPGYSRPRRGKAPPASSEFLRAASFPYAQLDPGVPETLVASARVKSKQFLPVALTLRMVSPGKLQWTVSGLVGKERRDLSGQR